jgi:hypothetical protein
MMSISISQFSGRRSDFSAWLSHVFDVARAASTVQAASGLLGFVLTPVEWAARFPGAGPFVPTAHPGAAIPAAAAAFAVYKFEVDLFQAEQSALNSFRSALIKALDDSSSQHMADPVNGFLLLTVLAIITALRHKHQTLTVSDILRLRSSLQDPFTPGTVPLSTLISSHRRTHRLLADAGQPLDNFTTIHSLISAVRPCGLYDQRIQLYFIGTTLVANQHFEDLPGPPVVQGFANMLLEYDAANFTQATEPTTTAALGFAGAANHPPPTLAQISRDLEHLSKLVASLLSPHATPAAKAAQIPSTPTSVTKRKFYCWTHGANNSHHGHDCRNRKAGHQESATAHNKMGGKS